jgi:hypothetical protein
MIVYSGRGGGRKEARKETVNRENGNFGLRAGNGGSSPCSWLSERRLRRDRLRFPGGGIQQPFGLI